MGEGKVNGEKFRGKEGDGVGEERGMVFEN